MVRDSKVREWIAAAGRWATIWAARCRRRTEVPGRALPPVVLSPQDRVLVLAPHPDDEVLGCGGILERAAVMHLPVRVVLFTYGDFNEWSFLLYRHHPVLSSSAVRGMGEVRHDEAISAAAALGVSPTNLTFLGYPDFGTLHIWQEHWSQEPPYESILTRAVQVPYANALRPGAPHKGEEVLRDLEAVFREFRPTKVFVSHPADHHPDHMALYLFTRVALWNLDAEMRPEISPYLVHFKGWPNPQGRNPSLALEPPEAFMKRIPWQGFGLNKKDVDRKDKALHCHKSQFDSAARYLESFIRTNELFGDLPPGTLKPGAVEDAEWSEELAPAENADEELTDEERAWFVGVEKRSVEVRGTDLVVNVSLTRPLAEAVESSIHIFGYRTDTPFEKMPKLHVRLGAVSGKSYDQSRALPEGTVTIVRHEKDLEVRVPIAVLGNPAKVLTSARTYLGDVPLGWVSWRIIDMGR